MQDDIRYTTDRKDEQEKIQRLLSEKGELAASHKRDVLLCIMVFTITTFASFFFQQTASDPSLNIAMLYTLGVFIITRYTNGYVYGMLFSIMSVLSVNFFFTYPYQDFNFTIEGYQVTFIGMFAIGVITSAMSTNMKEQAKQLAEQEKELMEAQKEKMRANLLRAVSHDLRTPLTGIIGSSQSYLEMAGELSDDDKTDLVRHINEDANWLLNMVENLLSVTRINNETTSVAKSLEAVDEVVSSAVMQFKKRFPEAKVHVKVTDEVVMAMMDAMLIQQVILNILQNAQVHAKSTKPLEIIIDENDEMVFVHIRDYGVGIDEHRLESIFDGEGYRSQNARADGYKGMGIGLSICKTIVTAHGGKIIAVNHSDGAEFCFSLPKEKEE